MPALKELVHSFLIVMAIILFLQFPNKPMLLLFPFQMKVDSVQKLMDEISQGISKANVGIKTAKRFADAFADCVNTLVSALVD